MCNLFSITTNLDALRAIVRDFKVAEDIGNFQPQPGVYPDYLAPIIRNNGAMRELTKVRWGMPSSSSAQFEAAKKRARAIEAKQGRSFSKDEFAELVKMEPDRGTTNVRNTDSKHWERWLDPEFRCVVPFTSFAEPDKANRENVWFAFDVDRPVAFFAGLWAPQWTSVRKIKEGLVTTDLFAFLTTDPNADVFAIHEKAMPVILKTAQEVEAWMTAQWPEARKLQRPLPDGVLQIVSRGEKEDPPPTADGPPPSDPQPTLF